MKAPSNSIAQATPIIGSITVKEASTSNTLDLHTMQIMALTLHKPRTESIPPLRNF